MFTNFLMLLRDHKEELLVLTSLAAVTVSLLTTIIGPAVQMRIARLNARTTILLSDRVKWMDSIQSNIATLVALIQRAEFLSTSMRAMQAKYPAMTEKQSDDFARMHKEYDEKTFERNRVAALLGLTLDIYPERRNALSQAIDKYRSTASGTSTSSHELFRALDELQLITRDILQEERTWVEQQVGRVKRQKNNRAAP